MTYFFHRKTPKSPKSTNPPSSQVTSKRTSTTHHIHGLAAAMSKPGVFLHKIITSLGVNSSKETLEEDLVQIAAQEQKHFPFDVLVNATNDFHSSNKLGQGGFGPVYRGNLPDGRVVAVKKLALYSKQGDKEFKNEVDLLMRVQHRNIVSLLGYCTSAAENLLVYEYVPNQSLDRFIFGSRRKHELDWKRRLDIISGIARGLHYLHEGTHICIIHRDVKASNILLDDKWLPKLADFGMARIYPEDQTHVNTRVVGTNGYMAPEYIRYGNLTVKADVFSFGVVVLELISGQRNSSFDLDPESDNLLDWAFKYYKNRRCVEIVDTSLASPAILEQVQHCIQVGLLCTQRDPARRPIMNRVVRMLSKKPGSLEEPTRPGYPGLRYRPHKAGTSSTTGNSSNPSSSQSFDPTTSSRNSIATISTDRIPVIDPRGKLPM